VEDLLERPAEEAVRRIALGHLEAATVAKPRVFDPEDEEGLHDFRVAVRRLRSVLRAYSDVLEGAVGKKLRRRLRDVARSTGGGRDAEVARAWLASQRPRLSRRHRAGLDWALGRLDRRLGESAAPIRGGVGGFEAVADRLHGRLVVYTAEVRLEPRREDTFSAALAARLERYAPALAKRLTAVAGPGDQAAAHRARLAAKRLRYLVEAATPAEPAARALVARLKGLQDLLGELHDAHVLEAELAAWVEEAAAEQARGLLAVALASPGDDVPSPPRRPWEVVRSLIAVARVNRGRRDELFAALESKWLSAAGREAFEAQVAELLAALGGGEAADAEAAAPPENGEAPPTPVENPVETPDQSPDQTPAVGD
jgi:CHAD domain-containing protein